MIEKAIRGNWEILVTDLQAALNKQGEGATVDDVMTDARAAYTRFKGTLPKTFGQSAYEGYFESCGGKSLISGAPLPTWDAQSVEIKLAWNRAAVAAIRAWESAGIE